MNIASTGVAHKLGFSEVGITDGLVGWWPLDGNANDISGNSNNGAVSGATVSSGLDQLCYSFDGVDDYIDLGASSIFGITNMVSVSAWIKISDSDWNGIFGSFSGGGFIHFQTYSQKINCYLYGPNATVNTSSLTIPLNTWSFVILTYSNNTLKVYLNGEHSNTVTAGILDQNISSVSSTSIGRVYAIERSFNGQIGRAHV